MCCCPVPNVNGTPGGYSWDGETRSTCPPNAPELASGDLLLFDEPGRCGNGVGDSHSHHFRVVKQFTRCALLVRHGGGDERLELGVWAADAGNVIDTLKPLHTDARYALLLSFYSMAKRAAEMATATERQRWRTAAADKRIKVRKVRGKAAVTVTIEPKP